ncbi:hypothetical protein [Roseospira marina]|nr:hypothetical protein [Roseospira marina]MBB4315448.1 Holliday junction resolvasome RuvABC endonuclease subunit [Roseospira marina]
MRELRIVGVDPSLCNTGVAVTRLLLPSMEIVVDDLILIATEPVASKQVRRNSDDLRRAQEISRGIRKAADGAALAMAEIPQGAQSARAAWGLGIALGLMTTFDMMGAPLIQVQPLETKLASVGSRTASKAEIIKWAVATYPEAPWIRHKSGGAMKLTKKNEHLADALAAIEAGILTTEFRQALALMGGIIHAA